MNLLETGLEKLLFNSRWLLAPIYVGMVLSLILLVVTFFRELMHLVPMIFSPESDSGDIIIGILSLIDFTLIGNLIIIIIYSGYENFVSKLHTGNNEDRPDWMGYIDFSDLKMKVIGSIVAISAIELLRAFMNAGQLDNSELGWKVGIHLTFVFSGVCFALMERLNPKHIRANP